MFSKLSIKNAAISKITNVKIADVKHVVKSSVRNNGSIITAIIVMHTKLGKSKIDIYSAHYKNQHTCHYNNIIILNEIIYHIHLESYNNILKYCINHVN